MFYGLSFSVITPSLSSFSFETVFMLALILRFSENSKKTFFKLRHRRWGKISQSVYNRKVLKSSLMFASKTRGLQHKTFCGRNKYRSFVIQYQSVTFNMFGQTHQLSMPRHGSTRTGLDKHAIFLRHDTDPGFAATPFINT